jgi:hypothetical protein
MAVILTMDDPTTMAILIMAMVDITAVTGVIMVATVVTEVATVVTEAGIIVKNSLNLAMFSLR